jgi:hypothetical protein
MASALPSSLAQATVAASGILLNQKFLVPVAALPQLHMRLVQGRHQLLSSHRRHMIVDSKCWPWWLLSYMCTWLDKKVKSCSKRCSVSHSARANGDVLLSLPHYDVVLISSSKAIVQTTSILTYLYKALLSLFSLHSLPSPFISLPHPNRTIN